MKLYKLIAKLTDHWLLPVSKATWCVGFIWDICMYMCICANTCTDVMGSLYTQEMIRSHMKLENGKGNKHETIV